MLRRAMDPECERAGAPTPPPQTPTRRGRLRRLAGLARTALARHAVDPARLRLHALATNVTYRVRTADGRRLALRLARPGWRAREDLLAEAAWLGALAIDTDLGAPRVLPTPDGGTAIPLRADGLAGTWHATLTTWVDGTSLAHRLDAAHLARFGELAARLHVHGGAWTPPAGFTRRRFERVLSRDEPDALFAGGALDALPSDDQRTFAAVRALADAAYAALDRGDLRVIHGDLWHGNVRVDRGRLRPLDFEDTIWGYRLHDLAMGLLDLVEAVGPAQASDAQAAFRSGYERVLAWPAGDVAPLQAGRLLWRANYVALHEPEHFAALGRRLVGALRAFLETGAPGPYPPAA